MMWFIWFALPVIMMLPLWYYIYRVILRGVRHFSKGNISRKVRVIVLIIAAAIVAPAVNISGVWSIVVLHLAAISGIVDLVWFISGKIGRKGFTNIYYSGAAVLTLTAAVLGYGYWNMTNVVQTDYNVETTKDIKQPGYRVALIADLHFGTVMDAEGLQLQAARIEAERPDIVVLAGDIVEEDTSREEMEQAFSILGEIKSRYGTYFVYGNHDKSRYSDSPNYTEEELAEAIGSSGIEILEDSSVEINEDLAIIGRADSSYMQSSRQSAEALLEGIDDNRQLILVDHQPSEYEQAKAAGYDLILSGHTHGGQIWPVGWIEKIFKLGDLNYGHERYGSFNAVVTSGIAGWGYPIRTEKNSEFVIIEIEESKE